MFYRVIVELTGFGGQPGFNVLHLGGDTTNTSSQTGAAAAHGHVAGLYSALKADYPSTLTYTVRGDVTAHNHQDGFGIALYSVTPVTAVGTGGGNSLPLATCLVIGWRTDTFNRHGRGRTFVGPLENAGTDANGSPMASRITRFQTAADSYLATGSETYNDPSPCIWQRPSSPGASDGQIHFIQTARIRDTYAVLRGRRQ